MLFPTLGMPKFQYTQILSLKMCWLRIRSPLTTYDWNYKDIYYNLPTKSSGIGNFQVCSGALQYQTTEVTFLHFS